MLVLTRKIGEKIIITLPDNEEIVVTLLDTQFDKARFGVSAPKHIPVHREEINQKMHKPVSLAEGA